MAFNYQSSARNSVLETVALIVIIVLVFWFFIRPQNTVLSLEKDNLAQAKAENQAVAQDKQALAELTAKLNKARPDLPAVDQALPLQSRPTQAEFLINDLITAAGMQTTEMTLQITEESAVSVAGNKALLKDPYNVNRKLQTTNLQISVSGGVDQFKDLLQLLETNGRIMDVSTLQMSTDGDTPVFGLKLKVYSYVP